MAINSTSIYLGGYTSGSLAESNGGLSDVVLAKYDLGGNFQWVKQLGNSTIGGTADDGNDIVSGLALDSSGVYVGGYTTGSFAETNGGSTDSFLVKFTLDGRYALVSGLGAFGSGAPSEGNNLVVIEVSSHKVVKTLALGGGAAGILMDPAGSRAFVAVNQGDKVAVIDLHSLTVTGEIPTHQPDGMAWAKR